MLWGGVFSNLLECLNLRSFPHILLLVYLRQCVTGDPSVQIHYKYAFVLNSNN